MAKKIEEGISIFFSHQRTADNTLTMTHEYDDHGIKCLNYDGDLRPVEPHCVNCGDKPDDCECDKFVPATYWDESAERWIDGREYIPWDLLDFGTFDANQCGICRVRGSWPWAWAGEGRLNEDTICSDCDKVFVWDEDKDGYKRRPRLRCRPPVGPPKENEPDYDMTTFFWSTVEELLEEHKPTTQQRFRRWKRGDYIELEYRKTTGRNPSWYYWAIRPCDNFTWVVIAYRNGSIMEMEWCQQLLESELDRCENAPNCGCCWDSAIDSPHEEEQDEDDGFENCTYCGYTHHYEDKCPTGKQCEKYERWRSEEQDEDEE